MVNVPVNLHLIAGFLPLGKLDSNTIQAQFKHYEMNRLLTPAS